LGKTYGGLKRIEGRDWTDEEGEIELWGYFWEGFLLYIYPKKGYFYSSSAKKMKKSWKKTIKSGLLTV